MLNLGSKTSLSSHIFTIPSTFRDHAETLRQGHFLDLHTIVFVKNDQITISVPIILSIYRWILYNSKKCRLDNQIHTTQFSASLFFCKLLFEVKKLTWDSIKPWNENLYRWFLIVSTRHVLLTPWLSIQFTSLSYWCKDYLNGLRSYFATLSYG